MDYFKLIGYSFPEFDWVPSPTYILRRAMVLKELVPFSPGKTLEIGSGSGSFLRELADLGYSGVGIEQSPEARRLASLILSGVRQFNIYEDVSLVSGQLFDFLFAFEVLEHVKDDYSALCSWVDCLNPGGMVMLSVPAHESKWDYSDVWAGHYRRYEKTSLRSLLEKAGLTVVSIKSYGWPLTNMLKPLRSHIRKRQMGDVARSDATTNITERSNRSGIDRRNEKRVFPLYTSLLGRLFLHFFIRLQYIAMNSELGIGYLIVAKKNA